MSNYLCSRCGRVFSHEETLSFCPFCGTAYSQASQPIQPATRIVISSDSERTVQEKYWRSAQYTLRSFFYVLNKTVTPRHTKPETSPTSFEDWYESLKTRSSAASFRRECDRYLDSIAQHLSSVPAQSPASAFDLNKAQTLVDQWCFRLSEACGAVSHEVIAPQIASSAESALQETHYDSLTDSDRKLLYESLLEVKIVLFKIIQENSVFAALVPFNSIRRDGSKTISPASLSSDLKSLSKKDYDPFFGESYDDFVAAFWRALLILTEDVSLQNITPYDEYESALVAAIKGYISDWENALSIILDRSYQQQADMIKILQQIEMLYKELEACQKAKDVES